MNLTTAAVLAVTLVFIPHAAHAADEPKPDAKYRVAGDVPYAEPANPRQMLDVYAPPGAKNLPVVFWIHGGGWVGGDKSIVSIKPQAFGDKGYVLVSTSYRYVSDVKMAAIMSDIAKGIRWTHDHAAQYGGDSNRMFVMGHSAGAQLAALVCTDERYLKAEGLESLEFIKGCVPVDGDTYDVPMEIATTLARSKATGEPLLKFGHPEKFGDPAHQHDLSSVYHVARGKHIPPFLLLYVAAYPETTAQAKRLRDVLLANGIQATTFAAKDTDHEKLNANLGLPGDPATKVLYEFMEMALKK
jgi:acetyl esterase/lipase